MDPNAALERFLDGYYRDKTSGEGDVTGAARDLVEWLDKGGFMPEVDRESLRALLQIAVDCYVPPT